MSLDAISSQSGVAGAGQKEVVLHETNYGNKFLLSKDEKDNFIRIENVKKKGRALALISGVINGVVTGSLWFLIADLILKHPFEKVARGSFYFGLGGLCAGTCIGLYKFNKMLNKSLNKD